jgi:hypothetical protein
MHATLKQDALILMEDLCKHVSKSIADFGQLSGGNMPGYTSQRIVIKQLFDKTSRENYTWASIVLRLTVIDSLYSTNAAYSYFSIEELATAIYNIGRESEAATYFYGIACGNDDTGKLFCGKYGMRKNLDDGGALISLISKYAYYVLLQNPQTYPLGFPIYDSLVLKMLPIVSNYLGCPKSKPQKKEIKPFVTAIDEVRKALLANNSELFCGFQAYDALDIYLWRMGKIDAGNYSLLLEKQDYETFINNIGMKSYKAKNNSQQNFNNEVRDRCSHYSIANIVKDVSVKPPLQSMIEHWKQYYTLRTSKY